jgi:hypothetical protein
VIFYETQAGEQGWRTTPTVLDHADNPEFTLEIVVDGKPYSEAKFRMKNAWSAARIDALPEETWPPEELDFPEIDRA